MCSRCYILFIYPENPEVIVFSPALTGLHVSKADKVKSYKCFGKTEQSFEVSNKIWE